MNIKEIEILRNINKDFSQRELANRFNISLGKVNQIITKLL